MGNVMYNFVRNAGTEISGIYHKERLTHKGHLCNLISRAKQSQTNRSIPLVITNLLIWMIPGGNYVHPESSLKQIRPLVIIQF